MNIMMFFASLVILCIIIIFTYKGLKNRQLRDSALRQRAVFNSSEQLTFTRLKEILPEANILAHVSFNALLTTKYLHTRRKYQKMFADFVILDRDCRVMAVVILEDSHLVKRSRISADQYALLAEADYRLIRYTGVPEYQQVREDFLLEFSKMQNKELQEEYILGKPDLYHDRVARIRAYG